MSKTFFDELYITALMAAPSLGRRSWYHSPSDKIRTAALISQSRHWLYGRVKRVAERRLFFFTVVRQLSYLFLIITGNSRRFVTFEKTGRIFSRFSHRFYLVLSQPFYNAFLNALFESYNRSYKTDQQNNSRNR